MFGDGKSLDLTPSFTPDGSQIVFSSNRGGRRLSIWEMSAAGDPGGHPTHQRRRERSLADSRFRSQAAAVLRIIGRHPPRSALYMTQLGATTPHRSRPLRPAFQPRVSPKGDSILFTGINERRAKRQIFRMPDRGGVPVTLSSPDADEFDAVWSQDGTHIGLRLRSRHR